jgi:hypothetical protein
MRMRAYRRIARLVRTRRRPLLLAVGALLIIMSMVLPSSIAFVSGMMVLGLGVPDGLPTTFPAAIVRGWESPQKRRADRP